MYHERVKKSYNHLVTIPEGKRQLGRHRRKRRGNIEADLKEICGGVEIIQLTQDTALGTMTLNSRIQREVRDESFF
jgi:hypothetical protein